MPEPPGSMRTTRDRELNALAIADRDRSCFNCASVDFVVAPSRRQERDQAKQDPEPISVDLRVRPSQNGFRTTYNAMLRTFLYRS